ncbi:OLC1v1019401C1 [Oldenlandia corymbosa var. corymbosa]|uniref:OLC1v1019401C1 n=1 Tax=Oldenlandia corymbosa var. corymbosa TaxID=529605 RepID=A0AAV1EDZ3_OLDCO|nr:OLC1v1019401C1 [Oldenlandia corymbosa var. corymbosa]
MEKSGIPVDIIDSPALPLISEQKEMEENSGRPIEATVAINNSAQEYVAGDTEYQQSSSNLIAAADHDLRASPAADAAVEKIPIFSATSGEPASSSEAMEIRRDSIPPSLRISWVQQSPVIPQSTANQRDPLILNEGKVKSVNPQSNPDISTSTEEKSNPNSSNISPPDN